MRARLVGSRGHGCQYYDGIISTIPFWHSLLPLPSPLPFSLFLPSSSSLPSSFLSLVPSCMRPLIFATTMPSWSTPTQQCCIHYWYAYITVYYSNWYVYITVNYSNWYVYITVYYSKPYFTGTCILADIYTVVLLLSLRPLPSLLLLCRGCMHLVLMVWTELPHSSTLLCK